METQMVDAYEEFVPDSDDEGISRPVMLNVKKVVSAKPDKVVGGSLSHSNDSLRGAAGSASKLFSVYTRRKMKPACAQPVSGTTIIRHNITDRKNSFGHGSIHAEAYLDKQLGMEDNGSCNLEHQVSVQECNGQLRELNNEYNNLYKTEKDCTRLGAECETGKLSYTDSLGPGEPSEADALEFVDRFISCNNLIMSEKVELPNMTNRDNSTPVSCGKGPQSLAKRASLGTTIRMTGIFEWNDHQIGEKEGGIESKREDLNIIGEGTEPRCINMSQSSRKLNVQGYRNLNFRCREKSPIRAVRIDFSSSSSVAHNAKEVGEAVQLSEMKVDKEKRDQLHGESPDQQLQTDGLELDVPETFDVGFDTQMAAEAMESLFYAPVTNSMIGYAHQDADKKVEDSSEGLPQKRDSPTSNQLGLGAVARSLKQKSNPSKKSGPSISKSYRKEAKSKKELNPGLPDTRKAKQVKSLPENPTIAKKQRCGSFKLPKQGKLHDASEYNSKQINNSRISSSVKCSSSGEGSFEGKSLNLPTIARRSRRLSTVYQSKEPRDMRHVKEVSIQKKRKRTTQHVDSFEVPTCGELHKTKSSLSAGARNMKVSQQDQREIITDQGSNLLHVGLWNHPKGKRKHRGSTRNLYGESHTTPSTSVKLGTDYTNTDEDKSNSERNRGNSSFITYVKRKPRSSSVYTHHVGSSLVRKCEKNLLDCNSDERVSADAAHLCSPLTSKLGQDEVLGSRNLPSSAAGSSHISNFEILTAGSTKASLSTSASHADFASELDGRSVIHKRSRTPLLKELISLGVSGPVLNSVPKYLRRRREMANVRVMFSNNLDGSIIKQQKKILARLGSSVASCCSEATHFVADRFVRTRNMLEAMALGKPVVTHFWLDSCGQASCYIDEKDYILRDDKKEKEIGFSMHRSLDHARQHPLLKGRTVLATPKAKPSSELISSLVKAEQGQVVKKSTAENNLIQDDLLILSCDEDYAQCLPFLEKGAEIYSSELLLNGIIIRKLEFERHRLFVNYPSASASG